MDKVQALIMEHGEKIAFGLCAAVLVAAIFMGPLSKPGDADAAEAAGKITQLQSRVNSAPPVPELFPEYKDDFERARPQLFKERWQGSISIETGTSYAFYPVDVPDVIIERDPREITKFIWPPTGLTVNGSRDQVALSWSPDPRHTSGDPEMQEKVVPIEAWQVERRRQDDSGAWTEWAVLEDDVSGGSTSWIDRDIAPETAYQWRVRAWSEAAPKNHVKDLQRGGRYYSAACEPMGLATMGDVRIMYTNYSASEGVAKAQIEVERWVDGQWVRADRPAQVQVGEVITAFNVEKDDLGNVELTPVPTKFTLTAIHHPKMREETYPATEWVVGEDGRPYKKEVQKVRETPSSQIEYTDESGTARLLWRDEWSSGGEVDDEGAGDDMGDGGTDGMDEGGEDGGEAGEGGGEDGGAAGTGEGGTGEGGGEEGGGSDDPGSLFGDD